MSAPEFELARGAVRRSFDAASGSYDANAVLQARVRDLLLDRIAVRPARRASSSIRAPAPATQAGRCSAGFPDPR